MTVVVTHAAGVIGQAVAHAFLAEGRTVVGVDAAPIPEGLKEGAGLNGATDRMKYVEHAAPPRSGEEIAALIDRCEAAGGGAIETLVCVAPPVRQMHVLDVTPQDLREIVEAELVVPALLMQEAARRMVAAGRGRIIVYASMSAKTGAHPHVSPFAAAKGGLLAYMRAMASELAGHGVTVNGIATALFEPQVALLSEERRNQLTQGIPARRFGKPSEAAGAAVYLASEHAAFITGETLNLSGGRFMD